MKCLVTGGAGFIGSNLVERLIADGHAVVVLDNLRHGNKLEHDIVPQVQLEIGDVRDCETVMTCAKGCDVIYHLAAVLGVDLVADNPTETMDTEYQGLKNVTTAAIAQGVGKVVYASTSSVYGKGAIDRAVGEDFDVSPRTSYGISKRFNEIYLKSLFSEKSLQSVSLRFFNVYGKHQDRRMVVPRFFEQAMNNQPITVFGDGNQTRDFTYIDDVVESIVQVAEKVGGGEIVNVANSSEVTIKDVAKAIVDVSNSQSELTFLQPDQKRYDFEVERRCGSSGKLERLTGYRPTTPLQEGLLKTYEYLVTRGSNKKHT